MTALRSSEGVGRYVASERDITLGPVASWLGNLPPLIYCHASGVDALGCYAGTYQNATIRALAESFTTTVPDLGLETWGNDTGRTRVGQGVTYLATAPWSATEPVILVGASMGALNALVYALANPTLVAGVIAVIPALDLNDLHVNNRGGIATALINTAYGGAYNDATQGPTHSPVQFADDLDLALPIHLFTSSNDPLAVPATADAFMTARPQTLRTDMGAVSHGDTSFNGFAAAIAAAALAM